MPPNPSSRVCGWTNEALPLQRNTWSHILSRKIKASFLLCIAVLVLASCGGIHTQSGSAQIVVTACPQPNQCVGVSSSNDASGFATTSDDGATWSIRTLPNNFPVTLRACPTLLHCIGTSASSPSAVMNSTPGMDTINFVVTFDGGATWTTSSLSDIEQAGSVSCGDSLHCIAIVEPSVSSTQTLFSTDDGGRSWQPASSPKGTLQGPTLSCPSLSRCYLLTGNYGRPTAPLVRAWVSSNLGRTWISDGELPDQDLPDGMDCPSPTTCFAYGSIPGKLTPQKSIGEAYVTKDAGTTWIHSTLPAHITDVQGAYCTKRATCWAFAATASNGVILSSTDAGETWSVQAMSASVEGVILSAATCWSPGSCLLTTGDQSEAFPLNLLHATRVP